jgi:glycosyltransferase involved in cell wall biosynthesis
MPSCAEPITVAFPFAGDSIGGSHISVLGLLRRIDRARVRPLIILEVPDGRIGAMFSDFERIADPGARLAPVAPGQPFGAVKFLRTLLGLPARVRFLRERNINVVHSNDGRTHANWALAARLAGVPLLWHHRGDPRALGLRLAAPLVATRVLTVSSFARPAAGWLSAADRSEVLHSPFDTSIVVDREKARGRLIAELGVNADTLLVGYFGSFIHRKRPLVFVDAIVDLQKRVDRPVLGLMFGDAKNPAVAAALHRRVEAADAAPLVRVSGFRDNGAFWIAACDQLMVPAVGEPFGRTLVEAMLVGTPVVAAASGGNVEALEQGRGVLVPPDHPQALAAAAAQLANSPEEQRRMTVFAQRHARQRFGEEQHAARVSRIYEELSGFTSNAELAWARAGTT